MMLRYVFTAADSGSRKFCWLLDVSFIYVVFNVLFLWWVSVEESLVVGGRKRVYVNVGGRISEGS
jgi:hypothetical protein